MARNYSIVRRFAELAAGAAIETNLIPIQAVAINATLRVTDIVVAADNVGTFWLSTGVAGAAGHLFAVLLPGPGTVGTTLATAIELNGGAVGTQLYVHYLGAAITWVAATYVAEEIAP